nr:hypothetical protein B0A51_03274 [Rachicladosporium sp. CCFEE 5018]
MPDAVDELHARELVENALRDGLPNIIPQQLRDPGKRDDLNTMMQHIVEDDRHDKAPAAEVRRHQHEAESRPSTDQSPARPENLHTSMDHGFADPQQAVAHLMISNMARPAVSAWLGKTSTPSPSDLGRSGSSETSEISEISGIGSEESELMGQIVVAQALGSAKDRVKIDAYESVGSSNVDPIRMIQMREKAPW